MLYTNTLTSFLMTFGESFYTLVIFRNSTPRDWWKQQTDSPLLNVPSSQCLQPRGLLPLVLCTLLFIFTKEWKFLDVRSPSLSRHLSPKNISTKTPTVISFVLLFPETTLSTTPGTYKFRDRGQTKREGWRERRSCRGVDLFVGFPIVSRPWKQYTGFYVGRLYLLVHIYVSISILIP